MIKCPKCSVEMSKSTFQSTEVDTCPQCKGIWFDSLEQNDLRLAKGSEAIDVGASNAKPTSRGQKLNCPKCHTRMSPTHDLQQPHIVFEKCSVCYGVFFEAGEFTDLKKVTFKEFIKGLFK